MGDSRIKDVSSLLRNFFDENTVRKGSEYASFLASWKSIAGDRAAGHSRIVDVDKGNLVIEAEHPGWIQLLQLRQTEILRMVQGRFPELGLRGVVFRLAREGGGPMTGEAPPRLGPFGPQGRAMNAGEAGAHEEAAEAEAGSGPSREYRQGGGPTSLQEITDPVLRAELEALKKTIEGEEKK
jgi:hypothetical protein